MADDTEMADDVGENNSVFQTAAEPMSEDAAELQDTSTTGPAQSDDWTGKHIWRFENVSKNRDQKVFSDRFEIGTYFWRLLLFPDGNNNKNDMAALYLDYPEALFTPVHMSPKAKFELRMINQLDPSKTIVKDAQHTFTDRETDWGFTAFAPIQDMKDPKRGFVVNDTIVIETCIKVQPDEKYTYDSHKETGCVGLKNQGATCYMNSLLQYLFQLPYFRKAVYHMPTSEADELATSLPLALQSLFYKLQYSKTVVSTKDLTKSFGWGVSDMFQQHDVQELNRVLCDKLEEKMKGTKVERVINQLFEGHTYNYVQCVNVEYKSDRTESFMDLQLDVKGCKDIYASFDKYTEEEMLEGQNQYKAEGHGMQDARKGVKFVDLPPVLNLQLKRFEYDFQRDTMVKINDRYEFSEDLDLDVGDGKYLAPTADRSVRNLYKLHSVLVHSGGVHGGHYYAFIRPDGKTWLKFDDERVSKEDRSKALDEQYGGGGEDDGPAMPGAGFQPSALKFTKFSNAYMLVYIKADEWERIMCPVDTSDIADHLCKRLEAELAAKEHRQKEKKEAHLYVTLRVARDEDMCGQVGSSQFFDLVDHDKVRTYRVKKNTPFMDLKKQIADEFGIPVHKQRYWTWAKRANGTHRIKMPLSEEHESREVMDLREFREQGASHTAKHALMDLKLFLESPAPNPDKDLVQLRDTWALLFVKQYDPKQEKLSYVGRLWVMKSYKGEQVQQVICKLLQIPNQELEIYEEVKFEPTVMVNRLNPKQALSDMDCDSGDIFIVQQVVGPEEEAELRHPHADVYLRYIQHRRMVHFKRLEDPKEEGFTLELHKEMDYEQITATLAGKLMLEDASKLRLTRHNQYMQQPHRNPVKYRDPILTTLDRMLQHAQHLTDTLYYEVLDLPLPQLEQLKTIRVSFHNDKTELVDTYTLRIPKAGSVKELLQELDRQLPQEHQGQQLRLLEVYQGKIFKVVPGEENVDKMDDTYWVFRAEPVPADQQELQPGSKLITCFHYQLDKESRSALDKGKDVAQLQPVPFGDPFFLAIREDDTLAAAKARVQAKLGVAPEEFAKWRFSHHEGNSKPEYLDDEEVLSKYFSSRLHTNAEYMSLGLEHEDKGPRRPQHYNRYIEHKAIKIYS